MIISPENAQRAIDWAHARLRACEETMRTSTKKESRDWAYGESVAIGVMLKILAGEMDGSGRPL